MENARIHVQDSMYALLVTYLMFSNRNILANFNPSLAEESRYVAIDGIQFKIAHLLPGQSHEIPGVNIVFYEEYSQFIRVGINSYERLMVVHLYVNKTDNPIADDRTLLKLQRKVDEAMYENYLHIVDFMETPPVALAKKCVHWNITSVPDGWQELTDLDSNPYLHRAKNFRLFYDDAAIT